MQQTGLFRKEALDNLSAPEQLDSMLTITSPRSWMAIIGVGLIFLSLLVWGIFGSISTRVPGQGILLKPGGIARVVSTLGGQVIEINTTQGDSVNSGQVVATVRNSEGEAIPVYSNHDGKVLELFIREGDLVSSGSQLFSMEIGKEDGLENLETILFVPVEVGQRISPGMEAYIAPAVINKEEYGYMVGEVSYVSEFPSTFEGILSILGNEELATRLVGQIVPVQIRIELIIDKDTPSGYKWTSGRGPDTIISSGTICEGFITTQSIRPISFVFPAISN